MYYGQQIHPREANYVLARIRFLIGVGPEPTVLGWGATLRRKERLDEVAANIVEATLVEAVGALEGEAA